MHIQTTNPVREIFDYDFNFISGQFLGVTVDPHYGDFVDESDPATITIFLGARPAQNGGEAAVEERVCIFKANLAYRSFRVRKVTSKTPEEIEEWNQLMKELTNSKTPPLIN